MALPVNFEEKAKAPPAANGAGYPYRLSARDLMRNFVFSSVVIPKTTPEGITNGIKEVAGVGEGGYPCREIYAQGFPSDAVAGDMMYFDGTDWISLPIGASGDKLVVYAGLPAWVTPPTSGTGEIIFRDCDGAEVARLEWNDGLISTSGSQEVESGCSVVSSSPPPP